MCNKTYYCLQALRNQLYLFMMNKSLINHKKLGNCMGEILISK